MMLLSFRRLWPRLLCVDASPRLLPPNVGVAQCLYRLKAPVRLDDCDIDGIHSLIARWSIRQPNAIHVEYADIFNGLEESGTSNWIFGVLQRLYNQSAADVAFERDKAGCGARINGFQGLLVARYKRNFRVIRKRNHLCYHDTLAVMTKLSCQWLAPYERDVHEHGIQFDHARELDKFRAWLIGADHYHCLWMTPPNRQQGSLNGSCPAHVRAFRHETQASLFKSPSYPVKAGATERIVLVQNGYLREAEIASQMLNPRLRFLSVRGTRVDHVCQRRVPQKLGASEWRDKRHPLFGRNRLHGL